MWKQLIIWETFDYVLLFILALLPFIYKLLFWLYTIQLKEYRWDRFKEYLFTKQGKNAIFNVFSILEAILIIFLIWITIYHNFQTPYGIVFFWVFYQIFFWYLIILNIFVIWKILRKRILMPVLTSRMLFLLSIFTLLLSLDLYFFYYLNLFNYTYFYILILFILLPVLLFVCNFISLFLVKYRKNKLMKKAMLKSLQIEWPIKIWVTWSYWKSSVKEFLSSILEQSSKTLKTPENINTELWVASLIINKLNKDFSYFVAEMWAYKIGEISLLWKIVNHKYWFLTAIWNQHIWIFWNQQNIISWKSEIAESVLRNKWILYINWDNKHIKKACFDKKLNIVKYWKSKGVNAFYNIVETKNWKTNFCFEYKSIKANFIINFVWEHNVLNLTWILAFLYDIWFKTTNIKKYIKNLSLPENRLWVFKSGSNLLLNDSYNLPIDWLFAWLEVLKTYSWNKVLVIDDVLELWKYSKKTHFELWQKIVKTKFVDQIFYCWVNYKKYFIEWLKSFGFKDENILDSLNLVKNSTILFEWRGSRLYFEKLNNSK